MRCHKCFGIGQIAFESDHVTLEVATGDEAAFDQPFANIVDEVPEDRSSVMAKRIDMDDRVDGNVPHSCVTKQTVSAPPDKEINPCSAE
jgi:hypothetical protein